MAYQVGDVVNGHRLGDDNEWHPVESPGQPPTRAVPETAAVTSVLTQGDVAQAATPDDLRGETQPAPEPVSARRPWYRQWWVIALAALVLVLVVVGVRSAVDARNTSLPTAEPSITASTQPSPAPLTSPSAASPTPSSPAPRSPVATAPVAPAPAPAPPAPSRPAASASAAPAPATSAAAAPAAPPAAGSGGLNTPVRDGAFQFTVNGVDCGRSQVGTDYLNKAARGQFCLVSLTVANTGSEPKGFDASYQKARDGSGTTVAADIEATWYIADSQAFQEPISPGKQAKGTIAFDIPKSSSIAQLELHESASSAGAKVKVS